MPPSKRPGQGAREPEHDMDTGEGTSPPGVSDVVLAVGALLIGLVYLWQSFAEGLGTLRDTGPGFFPLLVATLLVTASLVILIQLSRDRRRLRDRGHSTPSEPSDAPTDQHMARRILGLLVAGMLVPLAATTFGFIATLSVVLVAMSRLAGVKGWVRPILIGSTVGFIVWSVFANWLQVPLPSGRIGLM